jgi:DNA-binding NarL/FixJ family response regulator
MDASRRRIRVLIADDHEIVRRGIRALLETEQGITVCGEACTGREAVAQAGRLRPHVAIVDVTMPELNGVETTRRIRDAAPDCEVLVYTYHDAEQIVRDVFFPSPAAELLLEGYFDQDAPGAVPLASRLTPRQREILQLLAEGRTNKDIARLLDVTVKTVETHRTNLMSRLRLHSVGDLIRYAIREGMVEP